MRNNVITFGQPMLEHNRYALIESIGLRTTCTSFSYNILPAPSSLFHRVVPRCNLKHYPILKYTKVMVYLTLVEPTQEDWIDSL